MPGVSIVPRLSVRRGHAAAEFYEAAFGATRAITCCGTDENPEVVAHLAVGDASYWVDDESPFALELPPPVRRMERL
jgi:PhnB protein